MDFAQLRPWAWLEFTGDFLVMSVSHHTLPTKHKARSTQQMNMIQLDDGPQIALTTSYTTFKAMRLCSHATQRSGSLSRILSLGPERWSANAAFLSDMRRVSDHGDRRKKVRGTGGLSRISKAAKQFRGRPPRFLALGLYTS